MIVVLNSGFLRKQLACIMGNWKQCRKGRTFSREYRDDHTHNPWEIICQTVQYKPPAQIVAGGCDQIIVVLKILNGPVHHVRPSHFCVNTKG